MPDVKDRLVVTAPVLAIAIVDLEGRRAIGVQSTSTGEDHRHSLSPKQALLVAESLILAAHAMEAGMDIGPGVDAAAGDDEKQAYIDAHHPLDLIRAARAAATSHEAVTGVDSKANRPAPPSRLSRASGEAG